VPAPLGGIESLYLIFFQGFAIRPGGGIELISEVIKEEVRSLSRLFNFFF